MKCDFGQSSWRWSLYGVVIGGILGVASALGTMRGGESILAGYFGWILMALIEPLGEIRTWKVFAVGIAYYGVVIGLAFRFVARRKWLLLGGWVVSVVIVHMLLSRWEAQQFFEALRRFRLE